MKKVFTLILALAMGFGMKAQTNLTQAVDFTATDIHGTEVHLFDILDGGQYVLIDFFFTTCGPCQQSTPHVVQSYHAFGCNMHDVFYMEISDRDSQAACLNWTNNYGVEYPTIAGMNGGSTIANQYHIPAFPTVILIAPNHQIVIQDLYPIPNPQAVITALEAQGVQQHDCNAATYDPQVTISVNEVTETSITATFTPNADCASFYYLCATEAEIMAWVAMGADFDEIIQEHGGTETATLTNTFNELNPETEYNVLVLPVDPDGNYGEVVQETVTTLPEVIYEEPLIFSADTILMDYCTPAYVTITNNMAIEVNIKGVCDEMRWIDFSFDGNDWFSCDDEVEVFLPEGESIELIMQSCVVGKALVGDIVTITTDNGTAQFVAMVEDTWSLNENTASVSLFPNPANESLTLMGENLGTVSVFNTIGQKVEDFEASGNELRISTNHYNEGIYFVKANGQTLRFVVTH